MSLNALLPSICRSPAQSLFPTACVSFASLISPLSASNTSCGKEDTAPALNSHTTNPSDRSTAHPAVKEGCLSSAATGPSSALHHQHVHASPVNPLWPCKQNTLHRYLGGTVAATNWGSSTSTVLPHSRSFSTTTSTNNTSASTTSSPSTQTAVSDRSESPSVMLPDLALHSGAHQLYITITAFEKRYVDMAAGAVRDLLMLNLAPKSSNVLPTDLRKAEMGLPTNLFIPLERETLNPDWKKTRFTLIRGPHVDKKGMEQFERREYQVAVRASTHAADEVRWFLEHLYLYEFTGVQIQVDITSATYLHPAALPSADNSSTSSASPQHTQPRSLLSSHRSNISASILPAAAAASQPAHNHAAIVGDELQQSLQLLRQAVLAGLSERRARLASDTSYVTWHMATKRGGAAGAAAQHSAGNTAGGGADAVFDRDAPPTEHFQSLLQTSLDSVTASLSLDPGSADPAHKAAALLAALDGVMLNVRFDMLQAYDRFPSHFATFSPGCGTVPAAEWMLAVLKYGQYAKKLGDLTQEAQLLKAYTNYSLFAQALLFTLFKTWMQATTVDIKQSLALPTQAELQALRSRN